jgi:hypothetical protein
MRIATWGIVALFGFGLGLSVLEVHGSTNERVAIRHAVRSPFVDLRRRDARALCMDFTPAVDARLTAGSGSCDSRVGELFHRTQHAAAYVLASASSRPQRLDVTRISWQGDHASAVSSEPGVAGSERHWRLQMLAGRWRIATPADLDMRPDCTRHPFGARACVYAIALRFGAAAD